MEENTREGGSQARDPGESVAGEVEKCGGNLVAHLSVEVALGRHVCDLLQQPVVLLVDCSCCWQDETVRTDAIACLALRRADSVRQRNRCGWAGRRCGTP
jgi:hypothetical protein